MGGDEARSRKMRGQGIAPLRRRTNIVRPRPLLGVVGPPDARRWRWKLCSREPPRPRRKGRTSIGRRLNRDRAWRLAPHLQGRGRAQPRPPQLPPPPLSSPWRLPRCCCCRPLPGKRRKRFFGVMYMTRLKLGATKRPPLKKKSESFASRNHVARRP
jgi:hypothetical protein